MLLSLDLGRPDLATDYAVHHLDRVASTQDEARARFAGAPCLVTATAQDAGRGRGGAGWMNASRALATSIAFETTWPDDQVPLITLVAGLSAKRVLGTAVALKWPNDVVTASGDKVAGLLAERTGALVVMGMGVNLHWPDSPEGMAGVYRDDPGPGAGREIATRWCEDLLAELAAGPTGFRPAEYEEASATIGSVIAWDGGGPATAIGVDATGGLVVDGAAGRQVLRSGQVRTVRPATLTD